MSAPTMKGATPERVDTAAEVIEDIIKHALAWHDGVPVKWAAVLPLLRSLADAAARIKAAKAPVRMPTQQQLALAREFTLILKDCMSREDWADVLAKNAAETDSNICHSHDHCDANMAMAEAFDWVVGRECVTNNDGDIALMNAAWDAAKRLWQAEVKKPDGIIPIPPGWAFTDTGGGCTAFTRDVVSDSGRGTNYEWIITDEGDPSAPDDASKPVCLGLIRSGSVILQWHCSCLAEAVQIAEGAKL